MLLSLTAALPLLSLVQSTLATPQPGTVGMKFQKRRVDASEAPGLRRRASNTVLVGIDNEILLYFLNITVGTPGQSLSVQLDTGSADLWFPAANSEACNNQPEVYCPGGTYDASASSTYANPNLPDFQISYVDGSEITGQYISDDLNLGGIKLTNLTMAAAERANTQALGVMGVSFRAEESSADDSNSFTYPNIVDVLQSEGFIESRSFSLWLDDLNDNTGSILFGGVDSTKYKGSLVALPIQLDSQSNSISSFTVAWTGLKVTGSGNNNDLSPSSPLPAILDSGTSLTYLPNDLANDIFNGVGVITTRDYGNVVPCDLANDDLTFAFTFGGSEGPTVNVPIREFVVPLITQDGSTPQFRDGKDACQFGLDAAGDSPILFGDTFLRSAYVVYDLENQNIAIAETNFDASESNGNVQAIASSSDIPGVTSTATGASVDQTATGQPHQSERPDITGAAASIDAGATSRSATFQLSATGSGGSSATSSGAANSNIRPAPLQVSGYAIPLMVLVCAMVGGLAVLI
jgi:hypothetical protein